MNLKQYLEALKACQDDLVPFEDHFEKEIHRLTFEYGVYDNWPILLETDFEALLRYLQESNFELRSKSGNERIGIEGDMVYIPGTVSFSIKHPFYKEGWVISEARSPEHHKRQVEDFSTGIMLHPYQEKKIEGMHHTRVLALVICNIGEYAIRTKSPLCFPNSRGWKNRQDLSQIVYYYPE